MPYSIMRDYPRLTGPNPPPFNCLILQASATTFNSRSVSRFAFTRFNYIIVSAQKFRIQSLLEVESQLFRVSRLMRDSLLYTQFTRIKSKQRYTSIISIDIFSFTCTLLERSFNHPMLTSPNIFHTYTDTLFDLTIFFFSFVSLTFLHILPLSFQEKVSTTLIKPI